MFSQSNLMRTAALVALACGSLAAQAPSSPWDAGASLVLPLDGLKKVTHAGALGGLTLEGGYNGLVHGTRLPFRASVSLLHLPGRQEGDVKSSLMGLQVAADVVTTTGVDKLSTVLGFSATRWTWDYQDPTHRVRTTMRGPKLGFRFGFDYQVSARLTASCLLQQTELGTDNLSSRAYNPSWLQVGAKYRF